MIFGTLARFITCDSGDESRGRMSFLSGAAEGLGVKGYTVALRAHVWISTVGSV